jgi:hypothetical protein
MDLRVAELHGARRIQVAGAASHHAVGDRAVGRRSVHTGPAGIVLPVK